MICTKRTRAGRYRQLAGLYDHLPGQDDLCHVRYRIGDDVIHQTMAIVVELFRTFGLIQGELLSTDGQLEPSYSRSKGCPYAYAGCRQFPGDEVGRQDLHDQVHSGAKRLQITCPFPDVVAKVRDATAKKGNPHEPSAHGAAILPAPLRHLPVREQVSNLNQVLRGHYAYYGIAGNFRAVQQVHRAVERYWYKMLCSRSRKGHISWEVFHRIKARWPLQRPRLRLPYRTLQFMAVL